MLKLVMCDFVLVYLDENSMSTVFRKTYLA